MLGAIGAEKLGDHSEHDSTPIWVSEQHNE
jgi:hypothetical protein